MNVVQLQQPESKRRKTEATRLPADFVLTDGLRRWASDKGITKLEERFDHFVDCAAAKGYVYIDWSAAFRNACRQDWARLGTSSVAQVKTCCKCHRQLTNGHTRTRDGDMCDSCWVNR